MELRHLRCFLAVAEELHFARAAERLHIEQSPLSRAIKELEEELGVLLFARTTRSTRLTRAGRMFMEHVPRVFTALQQARDSVKAVQEAYDQGPYVGVADQALKGLAALEPADADADAVAVAIADIVNAPFGKRPYRVFVDPSRDGAEEAFRVGDRMRREMFQNIGLKDLLAPYVKA
jgi:hypothetical protein